MIIASTGDLHIRGKDLEEGAAFIEWFVKECQERSVDQALIAGDVVDRANVSDRYADVGEVYSAFEPLRGCCFDVTAIKGNHDEGGPSSGRYRDALVPLEWIPNMRVVREPNVIRLHWPRCDEIVSVFCLPWTWGSKKSPAVLIEELIETERQNHYHIPSASSILLAHVQVEGARMSKTMVYEGGSPWSITQAELASFGFTRVVLGDYHGRQQSFEGFEGGYVGAPRQLGFGEEGNPQGFEILDTETGAVEWIEYDGPSYKTFDVEGEMDSVLLDMSLDGPPWEAKGKYRRYRFNGPPPAEVAKKIEATGARVEYFQEPEERIRRAPGIEKLPTDVDRLRAYGGTVEPKIEGDDLERLIGHLGREKEPVKL